LVERRRIGGLVSKHIIIVRGKALLLLLACKDIGLEVLVLHALIIVVLIEDILRGGWWGERVVVLLVELTGLRRLTEHIRVVVFRFAETGETAEGF
jgi:hypothetical protein